MKRYCLLCGVKKTQQTKHFYMNFEGRVRIRVHPGE